MGILADFFVARSDSDAMAYPESVLAREQWKGFAIMELSMLACLVDRVEWDVAAIDAFSCVSEVDDGAQSISRIPDRLTAALATLCGTEIRELGQRWSACEEFADSNPQVPQDCLVAICRLAVQAQQEGAHLYLWNCT